MKQSPFIIYKPLYFFLLLFLLISCTTPSTAPTLPPPTLLSAAQVPTIPQQNEVETTVSTQTTITPTSQSPTPTAMATAPTTPSPTPTNTPTPSLAELAPACEETNILPSKAYPNSTYIGQNNTAVEYPYLYLTTGKYIGMIDISDASNPQVLGYWELPIMSEIMKLRVHNGIVYTVSSVDGQATINMLNLSPHCQFAPVAVIELPSTYYTDFQLEKDKLYISGDTGEGISEIMIFSIGTPTQPVKLGDIQLKQYTTSWSVFEEHIYSVTFDATHHNFIKSELFITDVSTPQTNYLQPLNIALDQELIPSSIIGMSLSKDALYIFSNSDGLTIIGNLQEELPTIKRSSYGHPTSFIFDVQGKYAFFGGYTDAPYMNVFDGETAKELFHLDFSNGYITGYQEIQEHIDYAFTNSAILVMDVSSPTNPIAVNQISLSPWSE